MPVALDTLTAWTCEAECAPTEDEPTSPLYKCPGCGGLFTKESSADGQSHRSACCNSFGSKEAKLGCGTCNESPAVEIQAFQCTECQTLHVEREAAEKCCSEEAKDQRAAAEKAKREVRVTDGNSGGTAIMTCDRDGSLIEGPYRSYVKPTSSFGVTECASHPPCQRAIKTGELCTRHSGPRGLKEVLNPSEQPVIRHGAPDGACGDRPYVYISETASFIEPRGDQLPERVQAWLAHREAERRRVAEMI
jgi:hypothetical protein